MDWNQARKKKLNQENIDKLLKEYEEHKNTPNINIIAYLSNSYIVIEYNQDKCEHSEHLGI